MGTKNVASLYVVVCKADKIGRNGRQTSTCSFSSLQFPYIILGLVPTGFTNLRIFFHILLQSTRFLKMLSIRFSWLTTKFRKAPFFKLTFSNFLWSLKRFYILLMSVSLSTITTELPLSDFWIMISLFLLRFVKAVNSYLERFCCGFLLYCLNDDNAVSLVFVFTKSKSSLDKISKLRISL